MAYKIYTLSYILTWKEEVDGWCVGFRCDSVTEATVQVLGHEDLNLLACGVVIHQLSSMELGRIGVTPVMSVEVQRADIKRTFIL